MADGSKRPGIGSWKEYQSKLPTTDELQAWFKDAKGVGLITGAISGNLEMMELEGRAVADGMHTQIKEMAHEMGLDDLWDRLNSGYCEMTPSAVCTGSTDSTATCQATRSWLAVLGRATPWTCLPKLAARAALS
jgi:hypothetical protein